MNYAMFAAYAIVMVLAPVVPFLVYQFAKESREVYKALRVLQSEKRAGETIYDTAEALAGDAHNWRGMVDVSEASGLDLDDDANVIPASGAYVRAQQLPPIDVEQGTVRAALSGLSLSNIAERRNLESRLAALQSPAVSFEVSNRKGAAMSGATILKATTDLSGINAELHSNWVMDSNGRLVDPQPPPQNQSGPALWPLIISELGDSETDRLIAADMQARHEFGIAKYGVPLVASNGRDHLADAYQEALDGVVYLRAAFDSQAHATHADYELMRSGCVGGLNDLGRSRLYQLYVDMLDMAKEIRELIRGRDGR
jgi:hypothetical protein